MIAQRSGRREIVVISNLKEEDARVEDEQLSEALRKETPSTLVDISSITVTQLNPNCIYLLRNIWGDGGVYEKDFSELYRALVEKQIKYRNTFNGKGDQRGKKYLAQLYKMGREVVPTFESVDDSLQYDVAKIYLVKPIVGGSSKGIQYVSRDELRDFTSADPFVLQPRIDFEYEVSFLFIDSVFQYAVKTRMSRWDLEPYQPTEERITTYSEIHFVEPDQRNTTCRFSAHGR